MTIYLRPKSQVWEGSRETGAAAAPVSIAALLRCQGRLVLQRGRSGVLAVHLNDVGQYAQRVVYAFGVREDLGHVGI